jgi:hypothetical protein
LDEAGWDVLQGSQSCQIILFMEIVHNQVPVKDLLEEEIGMQICCPLDHVERGEIILLFRDPAYPHAGAMILEY